MYQFLISIITIFSTVVLYLLMVRLYKKYTFAFLLPLLTTTIVMIFLLSLFHIDYDTYMIGGEWINRLLGPAVVALAYPLYKQRETLIKQTIPILAGVFVGVIVGMLSGLILAKSLGMSEELLLSIIPKSITTPVAIQVTTEIGGVKAMTVILVMMAGVGGAVIGPSVFRWSKITSSLGRGLALGSASHAIGTSKAKELGEEEVSTSSVSMTLCAILGSSLGTVVAWLFQL